MKKILALILVFTMTATLACCGATEEKLPETTEPNQEAASEVTEGNEEKIFAVIDAKDCFYNAGYKEFISGAEVSAEYTFAAENSEAVEWSIYVLDEAFDEGFRYITQVAEPVLVGNGKISVNAGQYVYVHCSANEFTTGVADENAKLNVTVT